MDGFRPYYTKSEGVWQGKYGINLYLLEMLPPGRENCGKILKGIDKNVAK